MASEAQLLAFLQQHVVCVLSTTMGDGAPHAAVVSYSTLGSPLRLLFCTDSRSIKAQNLMSSRKAAVVVGWSRESWQTVQMRGEAHPVRPADLELVKETHYAIHPGLRRFESGPDTIFFAFVPWWIRYSDFSHRSGGGLGYFTVDGGVQP